MSDADGDSTMNSSPELEADDEMFPGEGPSTPRNAATFALDPTSELSPPNSQGPSQLPRDETTAFADSPSMLNANGKRTRASAAGAAASGGTGGESADAHTDPATGYQWTKLEDQPGYEWKNTRAKEDEVRALEQIVDKGTQIKTRYGDPLKADVPMTLKR